MCTLLPQLKGTVTADNILPFLQNDQNCRVYLAETIHKNQVMQTVMELVINGKVPHLVDMPGCAEYIFDPCMGLERLASISKYNVQYGVELWNVSDIAPNVAILSDMDNVGAFLLVCGVLMGKMQVPAEQAKLPAELEKVRDENTPRPQCCLEC